MLKALRRCRAMKISCFLLAALVLSVSSSVSARTWHITPGGTGNAPTLQAGIDSAAAGDTVLAACGTYYEYDIVMKSGVCLRSETGDPLCATIDAEQQGRVIYCNNVDWNTAIEGFTITGGYLTNQDGGGIWCGNWSYPELSDLIISDNEVTSDGTYGRGGGMCCLESSARLTRVAFLRNTALGHGGGGLYFDSESSGRAVWLTDVSFTENSASYGGGLSAYGGDSVVVTNASFVDNQAGGSGGAVALNAIFSSNRYVRVMRSLFMGNSAEYGGAFYTWDSDGLLEHCTFVENSARVGGALFSFWGFSMEPRSCTFYGNHADIGSCFYIDTTSLEPTNCIIAYGTGSQAVSLYNALITCTCCDVFGNQGGDWVGPLAGQDGVNGNFSACPSFCHAGGGDFQLCDESPCLSGNHPDGYDCSLIGAWGEGCSCGPTVTESTTWGHIKSMYR
jgi:hypothetical protein